MLNQKQSNQSKKRLTLKILGILMLLGQAIAGLFILLHPKRWAKFLQKEKTEIQNFTAGKETPKKFLSNSRKLLNDFFIPNPNNDYKPKSLQPRSLVVITTSAIVVKILVTIFLFFTYPTPAELSAIISQNMISLINQSRTQQGLLPLKENTSLNQYALLKGQDMVKRDYFAHDTPEGKRPWEWINKSNYDYVYAGENLAIDFTSAETVHEAFLNSESHRRNILNPKYLEVGIAVLNGEMSGHKTILLVEFFGTQRKDISTLAKKPTENKVAQVSPAVKKTVSQTKAVTTPAKTTKKTVVPVATPKTVVEVPKTTKTQVVLNPKTAGAYDEENIINPVVDQIPTSITNDIFENQGMVVFSEKTEQESWVNIAIDYSNILFVAFLIFLLISLLLNIFIRIQVQHTSVILQSVAVIALILALMLVKFHFIQQVNTDLMIL